MTGDEKSFKVSDKRRFDQEGKERDEAITQKQSAKAEQHSDPVPSGAAEVPINFSSFIMSLATQALMQLGQMKPPPGLDIAVDREAARQTIDLISMLQLKTKGNLDASEAQLIEEVLHSLRMAYVAGKK